ncbi:MAG TPA: NUDIX domain-containing protein [Kineosporiaceae bacterium]|nr:NUDIX domain-containing protein [Kineosporiaceae bacterium]
MPDQPIHSVSVAGIVVDEAGRVLVMQRRDNARWEPPGGILERDETFEEGVVREVAEETGVLVAVDRLTGVYKNLSRAVVALVYRCRPLGGELRATDESALVRWATLAEVDALMTEAYAVRVRDALADAPASRAHDGTDLVTEHTTRDNTGTRAGSPG